MRLVVLALLASVTPAAAQEPTPDATPAPAPEPVPEPEPAPSPPVTPTVAPPAAQPPAESVAPRFAPWRTARLILELELYSQARLVRRAGDDLSELRLDRGELGGRMTLGKQTAAELRVEAVRSAVEGGSLGIDGDSTVMRVRTAQVIGTYGLLSRTVDGRAEPLIRIDGALGFVPDPWIQTVEEGYTVKPLSRTGSERLLAWPATDLSAVVRAIVGPVRASIAAGNGEGQRFPERNTGKTTTAVLEVVPINTRVARLAVAAVVRDGSIGVASIRDRRLGGGTTLSTPWLSAGGEIVRAYGIAGRGEAEGLLVGGWVDARAIDHVYLAVRGATLGFTGGGRTSTFGGALSVEPWRADGRHARGSARLWLAVERVTSSGAAMPLPGADAADGTLVMLIVSAIAPATFD